jgi:CHAT domain-containing protein/predicted negative regulator of RcsB-dependent stress response
MKKSIIIISLIILLPPYPVLCQNITPQDLDTTAQQLLRDKQFDQLIESMKLYITQNPRSAPAYRYLVLACYYSDKDLSDLDTYLTTFSDNPENQAYIYYAQGYHAYLKGQIKESEHLLRQSLSLNPSIALAQNNLGAVLSKQEKYDEALTHINKALELKPDLTVAQNNLKNVHLKKQSTQKATSEQQLREFLIAAFNDDNPLWMEHILIINKDLILSNELLTVQLLKSLIDKGIEKELADQPNTGKHYFSIASTLADTYYEVTKSNYLKKRVNQYQKWTQQEKQKYTEAERLYQRGEYFRTQYSYEKARKALEEGLVIYREINARLGEANSLQSLGDVHIRVAEYEQARKRLEEGLVIYREINARLGEASSLQSLGDVSMALAEYEQARKRYEKGLVIYREINARLGEANSLQRLGDVSMALAEYEQARKRYEEGLVIYRDIKDRLGEANSLKSLGDVSMALAEYEQARKRYEEGLVIYRDIKDRLGEANSLQRLGVVSMVLAEYEQARKRYEEGLVIYRDIKDRLGEANSLQSLGDVHYSLAEYEQARKRYEEAARIQKEIGDEYDFMWSAYGLAMVFDKTDDYKNARIYYDKSINALEKVWGMMKVEEHKTSFMASSISPYEKMIALLFKTGQAQDALDYAERSRARSFVYLLGNKKIDPKAGAPFRLLEKEEELNQQIVINTRELAQAAEQSKKRNISLYKLRQQLFALKEQHRKVMRQIKLYSEEYASLHNVEILEKEKIQALLKNDPDTVLLEYYTTVDSTYLWIITNDTIYPSKIKMERTELNEKIQDFLSMTSNITFGVQALAQQAEELYDTLIKPVEDKLKGKKRIGIIPHDVLHYLPFEALMKNGKFLIHEDYRIFYLPGANVYKYCRDKNRHKKERLIAFGNPDKSLIFSEKEVQELKKLYPENSLIFTRGNATEYRVHRYGKYTDILHFASHGILSKAEPLYSSLKLANDSYYDGLLEVHEIFQLDLRPAYLVTLSACETHIGGLMRGDEIISLTRAFIYAGTSSILASLWKVDDYYTKTLMVDFYRELKNMTKIDALYRARKKMISHHGKEHPFYWASFILIGDYQ